MDISRAKNLKLPSWPVAKMHIPTYLHISKPTLMAIGVMAMVVGLLSIWAYHYTKCTHPSYVCGILGLDHLRYERERELVSEEFDDKLVNGYRYSLHFQGISADAYKILVENNLQWHRMGSGKDRYYASHLTPGSHMAGDFYAQTDIKHCTLTYTSYIDKLLPVTILWILAFVTGAIFAISLAVVVMSISNKAARGTLWPANYATWRSAMLVSGATVIMLAIALFEV